MDSRPFSHVARVFFLAFTLLGVMLGAAACQSVERLAQAASSSTATLTPSVTLTGTPTLTFSPTPTALPSESPTPTLSPSATLTASPSKTPKVETTDTATPGPSPTATRRPTNTRTPTRTRRPTNTPTITPTPTPPGAALRIQRPGLFSKVSSPFWVEALIRPGDDGWVRLELVGEDGRTISEQKLDFRKNLGKRFWISPRIEFSIAAAAETGRLELSTRDRFGRLMELSSVDLILLKAGNDEITPPVIYWEPYLVRYPVDETVFKGGTVIVIGLARPVNANPVIFELIDENGEVVGSSQLVIPPPAGDLSHTPYQVGIPYKVGQSTPVRLTIRQESDGRIAGTVALWSMKLVLEP